MSRALQLLLVLGLILFGSAASAEVCDVDNDGDIDRLDLGLIFEARNQFASDPDDPRDEDANGHITVLDGRACALRCASLQCAEPLKVSVESPVDGAVVSTSVIEVAGTVNSSTARVLVNGLEAPLFEEQWNIDIPLVVGPNTLTVVATDVTGDSAEQILNVTRLPPVLQSVSVVPASVRLSQVGASQSLTVTGHYSDDSTRDLTTSADTEYGTDNRFVAKVDPDGTVVAQGNGEAVVAAVNLGYSAESRITVEVGVELEALELATSDITLRAAGESYQLGLTGRFSDGSNRDLTRASTGTVYESSNPDVAIVSADGLVTALINGSSTITVQSGNFSTQAQVTVAISSGTGFLRGAVFDDTKGLSLAAAKAALMADGGGDLQEPVIVTADEHGQYLVEGLEGDARVQVEMPGYTQIERRGTIPRDSAARVLDARLTPLDTRVNAVTSAVGGTARNAAGTLSLELVPGSLSLDTEIRLTSVSGQGLQGRLPFGWSPIAAVDIHPHGLIFGQPALLMLPNRLSLPADAEVVAANYDADRHDWSVLEPCLVNPDGGLECTLGGSGQVALLLPDAEPFTSQVPQVGQALPGTVQVVLPASASASGKVTPRAAPPGEDARAVGRVLVQDDEPMPSGIQVQADVMERFDLLNATRVLPLPFSQDFVLYAEPNTGTLSARFPITPSRQYTLHDLELGMVKLAVRAPEGGLGGIRVGPGGADFTDASGNAVQIPAGALAMDTIFNLSPLAESELAVPIPSELGLLGALSFDLPGVQLDASAILSIPLPAGIADDAQVLIAEIIVDPEGYRRLRLVAVGEVLSDRVVSVSSVNGFELPGITRGGQYLFLQPASPYGLVTGTVFASDAASPQDRALVISDTAPFAYVTPADGAYLIAGPVDIDTLVLATNTQTRDSASARITPSSDGEVLVLDLTLGVVRPRVVASDPAPDATEVPLSAPVVIGFSEQIAVTTLTEAGITLASAGTPVAFTQDLSADGQTLTLRPEAPFESNASYTVTLTSEVRDLAGNALVPFSFGFTTLDTSKPAPLPAGQLTAQLPDEDGLVLVFGTQGTAEPNAAVTATNLRTGETVGILALDDGSFLMRIPADIGDELAITLRNPAGQEVTLRITEFTDPDGRTALGAAGGTVTGPGGRLASILPRALTEAAILKLDPLADLSILPTLSTEMSYADSFRLSMEGGAFNRLSSLTLSESQNRFAPQTESAAPFKTLGSLVVPSDFLVNGSLRFTAVAEDTGGTRVSVDAGTLVVGSGPDPAREQSESAERFPTLYLDKPREAQRNQQVTVEASAPTARIDFTLPAPEGISAEVELLLVRTTLLNGEAKLAVVDRLERVENEGLVTLVTAGRAFPGATTGGSYAVVASDIPLSLVTGQASGPAVTVSLEGSPFVFQTDGPNANFLIPAPAGEPFTLNLYDAASGELAGTFSDQAPADGELDLGDPLGPVGEPLYLSAQPDGGTAVDINASLVFTASEPVDERTVTGTILVTDRAGNRVFGDVAISADGTRITFTPSRRWRFGSTYRYGVSTELLGLSGARLTRSFSSEFTTFSPRLLGSAAVDNVRDVAVFGNLAVTGGDAGLSVLDIAQADEPTLLAQVAVDGGASGVGLFPEAGFTDRDGQGVVGTLGLVAGGNLASAGTLQVFDLEVADAPVLLGATQLTVPTGDTAPAGVPQSPGVPNAVVVSGEDQALVAVTGVGLETADLAQAIPADPTNPGGALGPRYPADAFEDANDTAVLDDLVLVAGSAGLTLLDRETLQVLGAAATGGNAQGVAALADFAMDVNGDGGIDQATEIFDLAVVANGEDGTLQFFDVEDSADPELISLVRLGVPVSSVTLDLEENLAYAGCGADGVCLVDLEGPASVQPLDQDFDQLDDRLLGVADTGGAAGRMAVNLARGVGYVADGSRGLAVVQLIPPRTAFEDVRRDPVAAATGDEQSVLESREAFLTDDALAVVVNAVVPPQSELLLAIEEAPEAGGPRLLAFPDARTLTPLANGVNQLAVNVADDQGATGSHVSLKIQDAGGNVISRFDMRLRPADPGTATLESLFVVPQRSVIAADQSTAQLAVGGLYSDGRIFNLTASAAGTTYASGNVVVASVDAEGLVTGLAGGVATIAVSHGDISGFADVVVEKPAQLVGIEVDRDYATLVSPGEQQALTVTGLYSDDSVQDVTSGSSYVSSDEAVVTVTADGLMTAVGEGTATVTISNGDLEDRTQVAVEFRVPPTVTGIDLEPFTGLVTTDEGEAFAQAQITGTGSLEGLTVTFTLDGANATQVTEVTDYSGVVVGLLSGLQTVGSGTVTATIVDPDSNASFSDAETLLVEAGTGDHEPNDDAASASRLAEEVVVEGTLNGTADPRDTFRVESPTGGTLSITLSLPEGANPGDVTLIVLSENETELGRFTPTGLLDTFTLEISSGTSLVRIETVDEAIGYKLLSEIEQAPVVITSVSPTSGGPGTLVTITGEGFHPDQDENFVLFGISAGKLVSSSATEIRVIVPFHAVDGQIQIVSGSRTSWTSNFNVGNDNAPRIMVNPPDDSMIQLDPVSGEKVVANRLIVSFDPVLSASEAELVISSFGGRFSGFLPLLNSYVLDFDNISSISELERLRTLVSQHASVVFSFLDTLGRPKSPRFSIDSYEPSARRVVILPDIAYRAVLLKKAIMQIRTSKKLNEWGKPREVKVAIQDGGFDPAEARDFEKNAALPIPGSCPPYIECVNFSFSKLCTSIPIAITNPSVCPKTSLHGLNDPTGHGTEVTSLIAALNNNFGISGVLNSLVDRDETPFNVRVYKTKLLSEYVASLQDLMKRPVDVVNISYGWNTRALRVSKGNQRVLVAHVLGAHRALVNRSLFVAAAGNYAARPWNDMPQSMWKWIPNLINVGATATNLDRDLTGEKKWERATFAAKQREANDYPPGLPTTGANNQNCQNPTATFTDALGVVHEAAGSNCGKGIFIAAPGEEVAVATSSLRQPYRMVAGTSFAAPLVSGVAAILQAIRPDNNRKFTPEELKAILVATGDDITCYWNDRFRRTGHEYPGGRRKCIQNQLKEVSRWLSSSIQGSPKAVRIARAKVLARKFRYPSDVNPITKLNALTSARLVLGAKSNRDAVHLSNSNPKFVSIKIDALASEVLESDDAIEIPLKVLDEDLTEKFSGEKPKAIVINANGDEFLAHVNSINPESGEGILLGSTITAKAETFIPLSGTETSFHQSFPSRPDILLTSFDGRLLYLGGYDGLRIVNLTDGKVIAEGRQACQFEDLPSSFIGGLELSSSSGSGSATTNTGTTRLTGITLVLPAGEPVTTDPGQVNVSVRVFGKGALDALPVSLTSSRSGVTSSVGAYCPGSVGNYDATLAGLTTPGAVDITASVVDPATGSVLSDTKTLNVTEGWSNGIPGNKCGSSVFGLPRAGGGETLCQRLAAIREVLEAGILVAPDPLRPELTEQRPGFISSLALSPDGKTLYAGVETKASPGKQPGAIIEIDVDTYTDKDPETPGLQSDLSNYLKIKAVRQMRDLNGDGVADGDELRDIAVSPDGNYLYQVNGGFNKTVSSFDVSFIPSLVLQNSYSAGLPTPATSDLYLQAITGGQLFIDAPGLIGVFEKDGIGDDHRFRSYFLEGKEDDIVTSGWGPRPKTSDGALVITQSAGPAILIPPNVPGDPLMAKRPRKMAIRPDGRRALIPFFHTGNFAVLDLDVQQAFEGAPNCSGATPPEECGHFWGPVAVTPPIKLDSAMWPETIKVRNPVVEPAEYQDILCPTDPDNPDKPCAVRSPEEPLLFPWDIKYAQNGRFAVATHAGSNLDPVTISGTRIGENGEDLGPVEIRTGGSAITIINDQLITEDFKAHRDGDEEISVSMPDGSDRRVPYYLVRPLCEQIAMNSAGGSLPECEEDVFETKFWYGDGKPFNQVRGVAIQPFVTFVSPVFGDHVGLSDGIHIEWRDERIGKFAFVVSELDPETSEPTEVVGRLRGSVNPEEQEIRFLKREFFKLFTEPDKQPVDRTRYEIKAIICTSDQVCTEAMEENFSLTSIHVTYEGP